MYSGVTVGKGKNIYRKESEFKKIKHKTGGKTTLRVETAESRAVTETKQEEKEYLEQWPVSCTAVIGAC